MLLKKKFDAFINDDYRSLSIFIYYIETKT